MKGYEYIIVGDTKNGECLVTICGKYKKDADKRLKQMVNKPDDIDKVLTKGHENLRIKKVESAKCWWNDPVMCR